MGDIILTASSPAHLQFIIVNLSSEFATKDMDALSYFSDIVVIHHADGHFFSQRIYTTIIERDGMSSCKSSPTPIDTKPKLSVTSSAPYAYPSHPHSLVGDLQYLTFTRPDISYVVQQVCLHDPWDSHTIRTLLSIL